MPLLNVHTLDHDASISKSSILYHKHRVNDKKRGNIEHWNVEPNLKLQTSILQS